MEKEIRILITELKVDNEHKIKNLLENIDLTAHEEAIIANLQINQQGIINRLERILNK